LVFWRLPPPQARDVARRLDAPRCEASSYIFAFRPDEPAGHVPLLARTHDAAAANATAAALAELLAPPVTQLARGRAHGVLTPSDPLKTQFFTRITPFIRAAQAYDGWEAAAASAAAASLHGLAFAAVFPASASASSAVASASAAFTALAAAPSNRGRIRFLRATAPAPSGSGHVTLRLFKRDDADEPTVDFPLPHNGADGHNDGHNGAEVTQEGLARFLALASLPLLPRYSFALRARLEAAALPCLKLFLDDGHNDGHNATRENEAVRAAVAGAARALRGRAVAAQYDSGASYDMSQFGLHRERRPALGITADVAVYNATKWALPAPLRSPDAAAAAAALTAAGAEDVPLGWTATAESVTRWAEQARGAHAHGAAGRPHGGTARALIRFLCPRPRQVLAGGVEPARVSELEPSRAEAAAEAAEAGGVARLVYTSLRRDVLFPAAPTITLLELHASYFQKEHAKTLATLGRVARALRAVGAQGMQVRRCGMNEISRANGATDGWMVARVAWRGVTWRGAQVAHLHRDVNYVPEPQFEVPTCAHARAEREKTAGGSSFARARARVRAPSFSFSLISRLCFR
jgi:hypothetical protein